MKTDGKFVIRQGQDLAQAIQEELGLSEKECRKFNISIWNDIISEFENIDNLNITNNCDDVANLNNNFLVNTGAIVEISKDVWRKIVGLVNDKFDKNIEIESGEPTNPSNQETYLAMPSDVMSDVIAEFTKYNDSKYANQKLVEIDGRWYNFDGKGRCEAIYNEQPDINDERMPLPDFLVLYDWGSDDVRNIIRYIDNEKQDCLQRKSIKYNIDGKISASFIENLDEKLNIVSREIYCEGKLDSINYFENNQLVKSDIYDEVGKIKSSIIYDDNGEKKIHFNPNEQLDLVAYEMLKLLDNITEDDLNELMQKIREMDINKDECLCTNDNLFFAISQYNILTNRFFLDDLANVNVKLADKIINDVLKDNSEENDFGKLKFINDIQKDMEEHPNDYKKLTVDIQRIMARPYTYNLKDDNELRLNNRLDETTYQRGTGNCYLLSSIKAIDSKNLGREMLDKCRKNLPNGDVIITCEGNGKEYLITKEEILNADYLSSGDDDMRPWELAIDKYRRDEAYKKSSLPVDSQSGSSSYVMEVFFGKSIEDDKDLENFDISNFNDETKCYTFSFYNKDGQKNISPYAYDLAKDIFVKLYDKHAYRITRATENKVYFTNPWDDSIELSLNIDEFKNLVGLKVEEMVLL